MNSLRVVRDLIRAGDLIGLARGAVLRGAGAGLGFAISAVVLRYYGESTLSLYFYLITLLEGAYSVLSFGIPLYIIKNHSLPFQYRVMIRLGGLATLACILLWCFLPAHWLLGGFSARDILAVLIAALCLVYLRSVVSIVRVWGAPNLAFSLEYVVRKALVAGAIGVLILFGSDNMVVALGVGNLVGAAAAAYILYWSALKLKRDVQCLHLDAGVKRERLRDLAHCEILLIIGYVGAFVDAWIFALVNPQALGLYRLFSQIADAGAALYTIAFNNKLHLISGLAKAGRYKEFAKTHWDIARSGLFVLVVVFVIIALLFSQICEWLGVSSDTGVYVAFTSAFLFQGVRIAAGPVPNYMLFLGWPSGGYLFFVLSFLTALGVAWGAGIFLGMEYVALAMPLSAGLAAFACYAILWLWVFTRKQARE